MMNIKRTVVVSAATFMLWLWLGLIGSQHEPLLLLSAFLVFFCVVTYLLWGQLLKQPLWFHSAIGAGIGYVAAVFSAGISELMLRGFDQFISRDFTQNLFIFPSISLGWLYGSIVVAALRTGRTSPVGWVVKPSK